jgi:hypothetical protein
MFSIIRFLIGMIVFFAAVLIAFVVYSMFNFQSLDVQAVKFWFIMVWLFKRGHNSIQFFIGIGYRTIIR